MKVLVVSGLFPRDGDPMRGIFIHRQIRAVRELGVDAKVFCPVAVDRPGKFRRGLRDRDRWDGVPVRYFPYWHVPIDLSPALHGQCLLRALRRAFGEEESLFDVCHAHWLFPTAWAAVWAVRDKGIPVVASARGSDVHTHPNRNRRLRELTRSVMGEATLVAAVSGALARQAMDLGPPGIQVEVVHNGVDEQLFRPVSDRRPRRTELGLDEEGFYWVSVCRLVQEKGTTELLEAFARVTQSASDARLLLVGDGPEGPAMQRRVIEAGLGHRVVFAGLRHPQEVARWLQVADAFVLASHEEGLPNVVLEAMASGLPVVATNVGGTGEAVLDGISGLLVPPRDVRRLAEAMTRLSEDRGLALSFGIEGRRRVERCFGWRASARSCIEVYEKALRLGGLKAR